MPPPRRALRHVFLSCSKELWALIVFYLLLVLAGFREH